MKKILVSAALFGCWLVCNGQNGAWGGTVDDEIHQLLLSGGAFSYTVYSAADGEFKSTLGGLVVEDGNHHLFSIEFASADTALIGTTQNWVLSTDGDRVDFQPFDTPLSLSSWDGDADSPLSGAWLFSGRERNGEMTRRSTDTPRKTMKILTGGHFQWIAYHVTEKKFFGTGGGKYTAEDGVYTENIEFFSRDKSRIGASLPFQFERIGDDWHHKGKSSKGDPMYEVWSQRTY